MAYRSLRRPSDSVHPRRILYVAYPLLPVSHESCGGAEQMLSVLEDEMARRGHYTSVAACAGSQARGSVMVTGAETVEPDRFSTRNAEHHARILEFLNSPQHHALPFDLIHDKSGSFWPRAAESEIPVLATLHLPRHFYSEEVFRKVPKNVMFNCVSAAQYRSFQNVLHVIGVIENGIHVHRFPFITEKQDYLLWLGRVCEEKGPHLAIEVARRTGLPLVMAGQVYPFSYHQTFYNAKIRPHLASLHPTISFRETPTFQTKARLLSRARALLVPSLVNETSSLVAMEAMVCGTPVIGFRRGALPEVVIDRLTGFIVDDVDQMVEAVWNADQINAHACRTHVESNYSSTRMAAQYEELYERILASRESPRTQAA
ncbi:MAG TPA: glycosyltransferase [Terriglobales bacterium]|nr:glycosyltransferase [Terriglobales bacterium]